MKRHGGSNGLLTEQLLAAAGAEIWKDGSYSQVSPAYMSYFLAMTHQQLGESEQARGWFEKAVAQTTKEQQPSWERRMTLKLLHEEASQLLQVTLQD